MERRLDLAQSAPGLPNDLAVPAGVIRFKVVDTTAVLGQLIDAAGLPPVTSTEPVVGHGLDNTLLKAVLSDGHAVLLRRTKYKCRPPWPRAAFLAEHGVGAPRLLAANVDGDSLVDFVDGQPLADLVEAGRADDDTWEMVGNAFGKVHAVTFPAPLQGDVGPETIALAPLDPVQQLRTKIEAATSQLTTERPTVMPALAQLRHLVAYHAGPIRTETPCLVHGDANLHNAIVGPRQATLIDWDFPAVRYPLDELSAFEEHYYLHGGTRLPDAFFAGYGRNPPRHLLLLYRAVGCVHWLTSDDWAQWEGDHTIPSDDQARLRRWRTKLLSWLDDLHDYLQPVS